MGGGAGRGLCLPVFLFFSFQTPVGSTNTSGFGARKDSSSNLLAYVCDAPSRGNLLLHRLGNSSIAEAIIDEDLLVSASAFGQDKSSAQ